MPREEETQYEQDRLGNERRKLDTLRAQEGMRGSDADDEGIESISTAEVDTSVVIYSIPTHAQEVILTHIHAHNSQTTGSGSFVVQEAVLDGAGNITSTTKRSVPYIVDSVTTRLIEYHGIPFENAIAVESEFEGEIGVAVISDHHEENEPASEQTAA